MYKLENEVQESVQAFIDKHPLTDPFTEKRASAIRRKFIELEKNPNYENTLWAMMYWQMLVVSGEFEPKNIEKLGWDFENKATAVEQIVFTRAISNLFLDPADVTVLYKAMDYLNNVAKFSAGKKSKS